MTDLKRIIHKDFADVASYSASNKTAVSIRDGVLEYYGSELGETPSDKIFTVYRSPATIANASQAMVGITVTNDHIDTTTAAPDTGGKVLDSLVIDQVDSDTGSRLAVQNQLELSDSLLSELSDKRELSLGYSADLIPSDDYDFEQVNIKPHHLAAVEAGRCGSACSFLDRKSINKQEDIMKFFNDEEGEFSVEQVAEVAASLPEALKKVPNDKLKELMPSLLEILNYAKSQDVVKDEELVDGDKTVVKTEELEDMSKEEEMKDAEKEKDDFKDSADFKNAVEKQAQEFADERVKLFAAVSMKAKDFLTEDYPFADKSATEIMRDALATDSEESFADSELSIAFKMLKKPVPDYKTFGDSKPSEGLEARIKLELGE